jgi:hypothetical protein
MENLSLVNAGDLGSIMTTGLPTVSVTMAASSDLAGMQVAFELVDGSNVSPIIGVRADTLEAASSVILPNKGSTTWLFDVGTSQTTFRVRCVAVSAGSVSGTLSTSSVPVPSPRSTKSTYSAATAGLAPDSSGATDISFIGGSSKIPINVHKCIIIATAGTHLMVDLVFVKRSAANSGGTHTAISAVSVNSNAPASAANLQAYTVSPSSLGTAVGTVYATKLFVDVDTNAPLERVIDFDQLLGSPVQLESATEFLALNLNGAQISGGNFNVTWVWDQAAK